MKIVRGPWLTFAGLRGAHDVFGLGGIINVWGEVRGTAMGEQLILGRGDFLQFLSGHKRSSPQN